MELHNVSTLGGKQFLFVAVSVMKDERRNHGAIMRSANKKIIETENSATKQKLSESDNYEHFELGQRFSELCQQNSSMPVRPVFVSRRSHNSSNFDQPPSNLF
jgi:hypothetical protein